MNTIATNKYWIHSSGETGKVSPLFAYAGGDLKEQEQMM